MVIATDSAPGAYGKRKRQGVRNLALPRALNARGGRFPAALTEQRPAHAGFIERRAVEIAPFFRYFGSVGRKSFAAIDGGAARRTG